MPASPMNSFAEMGLRGTSAPFLEVLKLIEKIAPYNTTVLLTGETGTGKDLVARAIHYFSGRKDCPFVPVNCGAIPDSLPENEFFGHEKGAFTDAKESSAGLVAQAKSGTLFLDELEALSLRAQVTLLRFLQDHCFRPIGGKQVIHADVRVIAATNVDLQAMVGARSFREDLWFRLNVVSINLPPLRERAGDAVLLADHFVRRYSCEYGKPIKALHPDAIAFLEAYPWPGNVRELENFIHRTFLLSDELVIKPVISMPGSSNSCDALTNGHETFRAAKTRAVAVFEKTYLAALLKKTEGNITQAAKLSGQDRSVIGKLIKKHDLRQHPF